MHSKGSIKSIDYKICNLVVFSAVYITEDIPQSHAKMKANIPQENANIVTVFKRILTFGCPEYCV